MKPRLSSKSVTTRVIAEASGVSHVTVSRILRKQHGASEATRNRVLKVAEELGYRPNPLISIFMSQVRNQRKQRIVASLAWMNCLRTPNAWTVAPYRKSVYEAARAQAAALGYNLESIWAKAPGMTSGRLERILVSRGIHGIVVPPPGLRADSNLREMNWDSFAVVSMDGAVGFQGWNTVRQHDGHNIRVVLRELKKRGYRRIGLAIPQVTNVSSELSLEAHYLHYMFHEPEDNRLRPFVFKSIDDFESMRDWVRSEKPDAIICCDQRFLSCIEAMGLRVPEDIGLAHLNVNDDVPDWAGICHHNEGMGRALMELLSSQLQVNQRGAPPYRKCVLVEGHWVDGKTVRALEAPAG